MALLEGILNDVENRICDAWIASRWGACNETREEFNVFLCSFGRLSSWKYSEILHLVQATKAVLDNSLTGLLLEATAKAKAGINILQEAIAQAKAGNNI